MILEIKKFKNNSYWLPFVIMLGYCSLVISQTWLSEDGFIFFKYVDNLITNRGLVFNVGERVEGFTSPLWIFLLSFLFKISPLNANATTILISYLLSFSAVIIAFRNIRISEMSIPIGFCILFTNSAFIDFSTSGFETPLTNFLAIVLCVNLIKHEVHAKPLFFSAILCFLVLNRPETALILLYFISYFIYCLFQIQKKDRYEFLLKFAVFLLPIFILLIPYEIFRIAYYSSVFPNTFYEKKAAYGYPIQGWFYILDFMKSYWVSVLLIVIATVIRFLQRLRTPETKDFHFLFISCLLITYTIMQGGDYMHGRSLLLSLIFLCFLVPDFTFPQFKKYQGGFLMGCLALGISLFCQSAISKQQSREINNINDERYHIYGSSEWKKYKSLIMGNIPSAYGWRDRGFYYNDLARRIDHQLKVVFPNIGYFSFAAGPKVITLGPLIDYYRSKIPIKYRGKIGHEGDWIFQEYLMSRSPHFSTVPFKEWRNAASFKVKDSDFSSIIKDHTDDSLLPITNLGDRLFIKKFSSLLGIDVKGFVDKEIIKFLTVFNVDLYSSHPVYYTDFFGFLKRVWLPYAGAEGQKLFFRSLRLTSEHLVSKQDYFEECHLALSESLTKKVTGPFILDKLNWDSAKFALGTVSINILDRELSNNEFGCNEPYFNFIFEIRFDKPTKENQVLNLSDFKELSFLPVKIVAERRGININALIGDEIIKFNTQSSNTNGSDIILDINKLMSKKINTIQFSRD